MTYQQIIRHYGTQAAAAKAVGAYDQLLNGWRVRKRVPFDWQCRFEADSGGKLKADIPANMRNVLGRAA